MMKLVFSHDLRNNPFARQFLDILRGPFNVLFITQNLGPRSFQTRGFDKADITQSCSFLH